jgi:subtilase family serine protease
VIYWGQDGAGGGFYAFYGTSVAVPQWSGLVALGAQLARHRLGLVNPTIYRAARSTRSAELFHDVRVGNNTVHYVDDCGVVKTVRGYRARTGWDAATGVGSPIAGALVPLLAAATER